MDGIVGFFAILLLLVASGAVMGWVAFFQSRNLGDKLQILEEQLAKLTKKAEPPLSLKRETEQMQDAEISPPLSSADVEPEATDVPNVEPLEKAPPGEETPQAVNYEPGWLQQLQQNWMIWLGGLCVALAGIFMVKYSIDAGLLGPRGRIALALFTGIFLHAAAEWLRRRNGGSDPVFAALAGGASITLYGALLAALQLYHLIDPRLAFALMAVVSMGTMVMSLLHGPLLAMIGLVGAYVVPILVSDNSGNIVGAMIYSLIISGAALFLLRYVYRPWLWWGVMAGGLGWWLISLDAHHRADSLQGLYLALLAWGLVAVPNRDWLLLRGSGNGKDVGQQLTSINGRQFSLAGISLALVVAAWGKTMHYQGVTDGAIGQWLPLVVVLFFAARQRNWLSWLPWLSLMVQWLAWFVGALEHDLYHDKWHLAGLSEAQQQWFLGYAGVMALAYVGLSLRHLQRQGFSHLWMSLALMSPLLWLALCYLLVEGLEQSLQWGLLSLVLGGAYGLVAALRLEKQAQDKVALWFTLGAHGAYSLAVSIYFREAGLTVALAAQLLSLAWALHRYQLPWLAHLIKVLVAVVVARLTFNPWLLTYPSDIHWSLWTYGGATLFAALAARVCITQIEIRRWLEAAALHLLVLTLGAEVRYWLYDGNIFTYRYSLTEGAINTTLWAAMALTYYRRSLVSEAVATLYRICSRVLLGLSLVSYLSVALTHNPWWDYQHLSTTPVFNILLLAYGAPVVMALLVAWYHEPRFQKLAFAIAGMALFVFVNLEIRHLWQQSPSLALHRHTSDGELYTYSIVWLLMSLVAIVAGGRWQWRGLYRAGMALLALVIGKLFLLDMAGLEGLLRVASFMGLGLSLLGLAWLHRHYQEK